MAPTVCTITNSPARVTTGLLRNGKSSREDGTKTCDSQRNPGSRSGPSRKGTAFRGQPLDRELRRGTPAPSFYDNIQKERFYYGYSAELAQEDANSKASEKGPRGNRVTNWVAEYMGDMLARGFSVCTALKELRGAGADREGSLL